MLFRKADSQDLERLGKSAGSSKGPFTIPTGARPSLKAFAPTF